MDGSKSFYGVKPQYAEPQPIKKQLAAMNGEFGLKYDDRKHYANGAYFDLLKEVVPLRKTYRSTDDIAERADIAKEEITSWVKYVDRRKDAVSGLPGAWIEPNSARLLKESFDRMRDRNTSLVSASDLVDVHGTFA